MFEILEGKATDAQIGAFLIALSMKGETVEEVIGAVEVMRELSEKVKTDLTHLVDTCGTGGSGIGIFNVSTASAFVASQCGAKVAKHGNRSATRSSGSADLLEQAGVPLTLKPSEVADCIKNIGLGFMFAPAHHSAMKHVVGPRKEIAQKSIFNVLGPLTNPASAKRQVMGVYDKKWMRPITNVLKELGSEHTMIIHSEDGARNLLFVETSRLSLRRLSDDVGLAFTTFSELIFDGERIEDQQVFEISSAPGWEKVLDYSINNYLFYQSPLYLRQEIKKLKDLYRLGKEIEGIDQRFAQIEIEIEALAVSETRMMSKSRTTEQGLVIGQLNSRMIDSLIEFQQLEVDLAAYNVVAGESSLLTHNEPESSKKDAAHLVNKMLYINTCLLYTSPSPRDQRGSRMPG